MIVWTGLTPLIVLGAENDVVQRENLLELMTSDHDLRRPGSARNEGSTGLQRLDETHPIPFEGLVSLPTPFPSQGVGFGRTLERHRPTVWSLGEALSYERDTSVGSLLTNAFPKSFSRIPAQFEYPRCYNTKKALLKSQRFGKSQRLECAPELALEWGFLRSRARLSMGGPSTGVSRSNETAPI